MNAKTILLALVAAALGYLAFWPVEIEPVAWEASDDPGFTGAFEPNRRLAEPERLPLQGYVGPEDLAVGPDGVVYAGVHRPNGAGGAVMALASGVDSLAPAAPRPIAQIVGRPLGLDVAPNGDLYVADAYEGLVRIDRERSASLVLDRVAGAQIRYPNDVAVAPNGTVYLTDSSRRFAPKDHGGTLAASILDIAEHGDTGRLIAYDPRTGDARVVADGFSFANGVALSPDGSWAAVVETAAYRVWRVALTGPKTGEKSILIEGLPGFPDNIEPDGDGGFWIGVTSPRRAIVDILDGWPFLRAAIFRLPEALRPGPVDYGFVMRIDADGTVLETWQDPAGGYPKTSGALVAGGHLYVASLTADRLARFPYAKTSFAKALR